MLRALRIFNALTQFRDKHGREARGLEELSLPKEATIDPFNGEPLKLKMTDDGWIIYSVARNGVDDGGNFKDLNDYGIARESVQRSDRPVATASAPKIRVVGHEELFSIPCCRSIQSYEVPSAVRTSSTIASTSASASGATYDSAGRRATV